MTMELVDFCSNPRQLEWEPKISLKQRQLWLFLSELFDHSSHRRSAINLYFAPSTTTVKWNKEILNVIVCGISRQPQKYLGKGNDISGQWLPKKKLQKLKLSLNTVEMQKNQFISKTNINLYKLVMVNRSRGFLLKNFQSFHRIQVLKPTST